MTITQQVITIAVVMLGTMLTRFLPFIIFPSNKKPPKFIEVLSTSLPYAVMGMLIVYCVRNAFFTENHGVFELFSIVAVVLLHKWKKNMLLSIAGGTVIYMALVQLL